jgi:hypothetical protein
MVWLGAMDLNLRARSKNPARRLKGARTRLAGCVFGTTYAYLERHNSTSSEIFRMKYLMNFLSVLGRGAQYLCAIFVRIGPASPKIWRLPDNLHFRPWYSWFVNRRIKPKLILRVDFVRFMMCDSRFSKNVIYLSSCCQQPCSEVIL